MAAAGDVFDVVIFVVSLFPPDVLDEIWDLIESVSEVSHVWITRLRG